MLIFKMFIHTYLYIIGVVFQLSPVSSIDRIESNEDVIHLIGEPDFRDVNLHWEYDNEQHHGVKPARLLAFQVNYCEMQAWGPHRCRTKVIHDPDGEESRKPNGQEVDSSVTTTEPTSSGRRFYSARISGLRMATTYSFEVRPVHREGRDFADPLSIGKGIIVPTKGFSARATQCLPQASEVEVSTGPYFGGRIAVEAANGGPERCSVQGNPNSAQDAYILRIQHEQCGSIVNDTTVATYVIVQENLPILTHSTRRFLVLCTYKTETLTVRAGINLPKSSSNDFLLNNKPHFGSVEPYDENDIDYNELQPARLEASQEENQGMFGEIALVVFLVMAAFGGVAVLIWKVVPQANRDNLSVATASSLSSRSGIFGRRNIDMFSDRTSIYSITLSEKDDDAPRACRHADNTSEA